jgi:pyridoxal phosphate enzyme (YggS family)
MERINKNAELVIASKTQSIGNIREAVETGKVIAAGENRVQELLSKYTPDFRWDFIGQLQTNKVKSIIDKVELIHSLDRLALAETIDKEAKRIGKIQDCLIEVNAGQEEAKGGIYLENVKNFYDSLKGFNNIRVRGLMAVAPIISDETVLGGIFDKVYKTFGSIKGEAFDYLSMGMSNDFELALKCGANLVRLGRAVFGERG